MKILRSIAIVVGNLVPCLLLSTPAQAWDPSTTHLQIVNAAVQRSVLHLRWMEASEMKRGLFSPLRLDPNKLGTVQLRDIRRTIGQVHGSSGAQPLGGPGACPGLRAPPDTNRYCVSGDLLELSALQWLYFGVLLESNPTVRLVHHFVDFHEPSSPTWTSDQLPAGFLRRSQARHNGEPLAGILNQTNFSGKGESAVAWLASNTDPWRPQQIFENLQRAALESAPSDRNHYLAMAMIHLGALVHVLQDLSVPAHARSDLGAFYAELSEHPFDRGLALQEYTRRHIDVRDTLDLDNISLPTGKPLATTFLGHLLGEGNWEGLVPFSSQYFLSSGTLPPKTLIGDEESDIEAATQLLQYDSGLSASETEGAYLRPWPSSSGYLYTQHDRPIAAFERNNDDEVHLFLDPPMYREQAAHLLPMAVEVTRSIFDLLTPAWPTTKATNHHIQSQEPDQEPVQASGTKPRPAQSNPETPLPSEWRQTKLHIGEEKPDGQRKWLSTRNIHSTQGLDVASFASKHKPQSSANRTILVLTATTQHGLPITIERLLPTSAPKSN